MKRIRTTAVVLVIVLVSIIYMTCNGGNSHIPITDAHERQIERQCREADDYELKRSIIRWLKS